MEADDGRGRRQTSAAQAGRVSFLPVRLNGRTPESLTRAPSPGHSANSPTSTIHFVILQPPDGGSWCANYLRCGPAMKPRSLSSVDANQVNSFSFMLLFFHPC